MTDYHKPRIGTVGFDGPPARTYSKLSLVEYQETFTGVPSTKSLGRLRKDAGHEFAFVLRAPAVITHAAEPLVKKLKLSYLPEGTLPAAPFDTGPVGQAAWQWTEGAAEVLGAEAIYWQTPASFRPTPQNRRRLSNFVEQIASNGRTIYWDSQGLWEPEERDAVCRDLELIPCYDPLLEPDRPASAAYLRVLGKARSGHGLSADDLYQLADVVEAIGDARVALHTATPFRDARALLDVISGGP